VFFQFSVLKGETQKLIEKWGPILLWIATGAHPISQIPIRLTRILTCEDNMQKQCEHRKMLLLFRLFLKIWGVEVWCGARFELKRIGILMF
jgi:hypothetical protein